MDVGHNVHAERPAEVMEAVRDFISADAAVLGASPHFVEARNLSLHPLLSGREAADFAW